jgi:predicted aconitase with swiveling domain
MSHIAVATFTARHAMGQAVEAECLSAHDGFSARYDLNRLDGTFSRPAHKLFGKSYHGKILVLDTAKGGVASAWMLYEMKSRNLYPLAIIFNTVNPILAQGAAQAGITMLAGFGVDITQKIRSGAHLRINPERKTVEVLG